MTPRRTVSAIAIVLLLALMPASLTAVDLPVPGSPDAIALACSMEIGQSYTDARQGILDELADFDEGVGALPAGAPGGQIFKLAAASAQRMDKIAAAAAARMNKTANKCITKLTRLDAEPGLIANVTQTQDYYVQSIANALHFEGQDDVAQIVLDYINDF